MSRLSRVQMVRSAKLVMRWQRTKADGFRDFSTQGQFVRRAVVHGPYNRDSSRRFLIISVCDVRHNEFGRVVGSVSVIFV